MASVGWQMSRRDETALRSQYIQFIVYFINYLQIIQRDFNTKKKKKKKKSIVLYKTAMSRSTQIKKALGKFLLHNNAPGSK